MDLFDKRWNVRILALLHELNGARFAVMKHELEINADSLTRSLQFLSYKGWVERNPGYGHPLRPEYVLTSRGQAMAQECGKLVNVVERLNVADTVYRKWSVPLLVTINGGIARFNGLRNALAISPRALTHGLQRLCASELVLQQSEYSLTPSGSQIAVLGTRLLEKRGRTAV